MVGSYYTSAANAGAFLYANGRWTDLGGLSGAATHATSINTAGQVVGTAIFLQTIYHPPKPGKHVALIFRKGAVIDLNTLIPANSGFTITDAIAINDPGDILCNATNASGTKRAVLLTPK